MPAHCVSIQIYSGIALLPCDSTAFWSLLELRIQCLNDSDVFLCFYNDDGVVFLKLWTPSRPLFTRLPFPPLPSRRGDDRGPRAPPLRLNPMHILL